MNRFKRNFKVEQFKAFAERTTNNWGKDLLRLWQPSGSDGGLRLAVRHNKLNFYVKGQSVAQVGTDDSMQPCMSVHAKYVLPDATELKARGYNSRSPYLRFDHDGMCETNGFNDLRCESDKSISLWATEAQKTHSGEEKRFVDDVVSKTPSIIDLEMGLPSLVASEPGPDGRLTRPKTKHSGPPRIDAVCVETTPSGPRIVFWEAKLVNDPRLVSEPDRCPEVVRQVRAYETFFTDSGRSGDVICGYVRTCRILTDLLEIAGHVDNRGRRFQNAVLEIVDKRQAVTIDPSPRLLIFNPGSASRAWSGHLERLRTEFNIRCFEVAEARDLQTLPEMHR